MALPLLLCFGLLEGQVAISDDPPRSFKPLAKLFIAFHHPLLQPEIHRGVDVAAARRLAPPQAALDHLDINSDLSENRPLISWYPGHIAKAERMMSEMLNMIDVVVELRDSRAPESTTHPLLPGWIGSRGHVLVLNRKESIPQRAQQEWERKLKEEGKEPFFVDAKKGTGVRELKQAIMEQGKKVNEKRKRRGILPRPIRAAILGFPNVGKSAVINKIVGKNKVKVENRAGVTRGFSWIKIDKDVHLLDSPGVIPPKALTPYATYHLAICNDIGKAAFDTQSVAAAFVERFAVVAAHRKGYVKPRLLEERYPAVPLDRVNSGEEYIERLAELRFQGDIERAAVSVLKDFQSGKLGAACIEVPPLAPDE